jgi:hypothetical protein
VLGFGCTAFASIVWGISKDNARSRTFVVIAIIIAHSFLACFSLAQLNDGGILKHHVATAARCILGFNLATSPSSAAVLLLQNVSDFLIVGIHVTFFPNLTYVFRDKSLLPSSLISFGFS